MKLFESFALGDLELPNRAVMSPMTRSRATPEHVPTPLMATYYAQRAAAGLIITEGTSPNGDGCGYARIPGIWNDAQATAWKAVTDAVHQAGGRIALQIMDCGRVCHPLNMPPDTVLRAPSAVPLSGEMYTDQEGPQPYPIAEPMTGAQIEATIASFVGAAERAARAGFDMVELHGANGYLIDQFLTPSTNQRTDGYGGNIEGRGRFALEVARGVSSAIGEKKVGIRLSPYGAFNDMQPWDSIAEDYVWLTGELSKLGIAYVHLVDHSAMGAPTVPASIKTSIRSSFAGALILSGGYDRDRAEADLAENKGDLVAFGRPFLANPDLLERFEKGAELNQPDFDKFYTPGPEGYTDYPTL
ncbi:MAG: alkene reductase [Myxococcota bacterium]